MGNSYIAASNLRVNRVMVVRLLLVLVGLFLICYAERHSRKNTCPHCSCDCVSEPPPPPLEVSSDSSFAECGRDDPDTYKELKKDIVALLSEEIGLHENVTSDTLERTKASIMGAKTTSLHYQNEAEKCNAGIETCEGARERAVVLLREERKLTSLWMQRAHQYGWLER